MTYYSTGISPYLPCRGRAVECNNHTTAEILLKKGSIVKTKEELNVVVKEEVQEVIAEPQPEIKKVVKPVKKAVKQPKPKGRPSKK